MTKSEVLELLKPDIAALLKAEMKPVLETIEERLRTQAEASRTAPPWLQPMLEQVGGGSAPPKETTEPGLGFARYIRACALAKREGSGSEGAIKVLKVWGHTDLVEQWEAHRTKALAAGDASAGGFLVPVQFQNDVISLLRPRAVVRRMGPMIVPMATGTIQIPKVSAGATMTWIGENQNAGKSQQAFGNITLTFKKGSVLVPVSNDLLRYATTSADVIVRDDCVRAIAAGEDAKYLRGDGTSGAPKGLLYWINAVNQVSANTTVNLDNVTTDLGQCVQLLMTAEVPLAVGAMNQGDERGPARAGWVFNPRTYRYLTTVRLTQGPYAFRDEMLRGTLWGFPYAVTSQIPNAGIVATGSEVYFGAFEDAVIGEGLSLRVDVSQEAAYYDGSTVVAAFSQDQTVVRVLIEIDFALRRDTSFALLKDVRWGQ